MPFLKQLEKRLFGIALLFCIPCSSLAQKPDRATMDRVYDEYDSMHRVLYTFNFQNVEKNHQGYFDYVDNITRLAERCEAINFNDGYYRGQTLLSRFYTLNGDYIKALDVLDKAIDKTLEDDKPPFEAQMLYQKGVLFKQYEDVDSALYYLDEAYHLAGEINYTGVQGAAINVIAGIYADAEQYEKSLEYYQKALVLNEESKEVAGLGAVYGNLGLAYARLGLGDSAVYWGEKQLAYAIKHDVPGHLTQAYNVLTMGSYLTGTYDHALNYSSELYNMVSPTDDLGHMVTPYLYRAKTWMAKGMKAKARKDIESSINIAKEVGFTDGEIKSLEWYIKELKEEGDYKMALSYTERLAALRDQKREENAEVKLEQMELRFQLKEQENNVKNLEELQAATDAKVQFRNLLIVAVLVLCILAIVFLMGVNRRRVEKQEAEVQEAHNKLLRSQLNPHFLFNALSSIQLFLINKGQGTEALEYLSKFAKLMRRILENSRESFVSLEDEVSTLRHYLDIQKMRFEGKFDYRIQVNTQRSPDEIMIPPMFAQPFIENSLEHGIASKDDGEIIIQFDEKPDGITFKVEDNGVGLKMSTKDGAVTEHSSLATIITRDRIDLLKKQMGSKASFTMRNRHGENEEVVGTEVIFELPLMYR